MRYHKVLLAGLCAMALPTAMAQDSFEEFKLKNESEFSRFKQQHDDDFEAFRRRINEEYAEFLSRSWDEVMRRDPIKPPKEDVKPVPPVVFDEKKNKKKPVKSKPTPIKEVIEPPKPKPQPQPVTPVQPKPDPAPVATMQFSIYGTDMAVRCDASMQFRLHSCSESDISRAWTEISNSPLAETLLADCIALRSEHRLCDWAYLMTLKQLSEKFFNGKCNEAVLLTAWLYCQSGYAMRLGTFSNRLYLLYASDYVILNAIYFTIDGLKYYPLDCNCEKLFICNAAFPQEKTMSLAIRQNQALSPSSSSPRQLSSKRYPDMKAAVATDKNLISAFNNYPTGFLSGDVCTRWAVYANTPLSPTAVNSLYPSLRKSIAGLSTLDAVQRILNFVQTAFVYEYDDKVWGGDRAFFADESLYYPYCDCEDRSILFSRIVRDLLGLKVLLVYYPGHLATAVNFPSQVAGDYISLRGEKYVICDPTYIGASVGATMPDMNNAAAKVILLE